MIVPRRLVSRLRLLVSFLTFVVLATVPNVQATPPQSSDKQYLLPLATGRQMGPLLLGMTESQVATILGRPRQADITGQVVWTLSFDRYLIDAVFYHISGKGPKGELVKATTHSRNLRTAEGLGVGSFRDQVVAVFGQSIGDVAWGYNAILHYPGIWFGIEGARVVDITIVPREARAAILPYVLDRSAKERMQRDYRTVADPQERVTHIARLLEPRPAISLVIGNVSFESAERADPFTPLASTPHLSVAGFATNLGRLPARDSRFTLLVYDCGSFGKCDPAKMTLIGTTVGGPARIGQVSSTVLKPGAMVRFSIRAVLPYGVDRVGWTVLVEDHPFGVGFRNRRHRAGYFDCHDYAQLCKR